MARAGLEITIDMTPARLRLEARRATSTRAAARMLAVAHALEGLPRHEAARAAGMDRQTLRDVILRSNAEGLAGFYDRPRSGRPRALEPDQEAALVEIVLKGPDPETDGLSAYTLEDLASLAGKRWNVHYHPASMSRVMRRLGLSRQKARPSHPKKDIKAQEAFRGGPCESRKRSC